jgi:hypothetical protein
MAEAQIRLSIEELARPARVAVCGLRVERSGVVLNERLGPAGPLQSVRIKAVLEFEDERPVRSDGLHALDTDVRLSEPVRHDRIAGSVAVL